MGSSSMCVTVCQWGQSKREPFGFLCSIGQFCSNLTHHYTLDCCQSGHSSIAGTVYNTCTSSAKPINYSLMHHRIPERNTTDFTSLNVFILIMHAFTRNLLSLPSFLSPSFEIFQLIPQFFSWIIPGILCIITIMY